VAKAIRIQTPNAPYEVRVVGARATPLRDLYHLLLRRSWGFTFAVISGVFLTANALFAAGYLAVGGVANARHGSFADSFFFSVETLATIGYGAMYPSGAAAHVLVVAESIAGIILTALVTGLVFAKFSRSTARMVFAHDAVIGPMNGRPTLSFRVGNERGNQIVDARIRVVLTRNEQVAEGDKTSTFYRMLDLKLAREHSLSLSRSWSVQHPIDEASPLHGATPASFAAEESELMIMVIGLDDTSMQPVHAAYRYFAPQIRWGARYADILSEAADGALVLDLGRFHAVEPTAPTPDFPYSLGQ
jgi:inward rectifier potassium channel